MSFVRALQTHDDVPLVKEKMVMLIEGHFRGVPLRTDWGRWVISKRNAFRLARRRIHLFTDDEWAQIIGQPDKAYWFALWRMYERDIPQQHLGAREHGF